MKEIIREEGIFRHGLLGKGITATMGRNGTFNMIYFGFYHTFRYQNSQHKKPSILRTILQRSTSQHGRSKVGVFAKILHWLDCWNFGLLCQHSFRRGKKQDPGTTACSWNSHLQRNIQGDSHGLSKRRIPGLVQRPFTKDIETWTRRSNYASGL